MVNHSVLFAVYPCLLGVDESETVMEQLDPETWTQLVLTLLGLVFLGFVLMFSAWFGARIVRRYAGLSPARFRKSSGSINPDDDWWKKPLVPSEDDEQLE